MSDRRFTRQQARSLTAAAVVLALAGASSAELAPRQGDDAKTEQAIARAMELSAAFEHAAEKASPAVVHIRSTKGGDDARRAGRGAVPGDPNDPFEPFRRMFPDQFRAAPQPEVQSTGSGVIVSKDGYILTNNHVVEGAKRVEVSLGENKVSKYTAKIVGTDPATDLAVLKIEGDSFPFADLGDSDKLRVGEWVIAIGNPFDLDRTVTAGIVSAKGRVQREGQLRDVQFQDFIQTDAAVNPGNSGGPLLNLRGQVIGINSAILSAGSRGSIGIGFAIPANLARGVMDQLINSGKVERGWVGIGPQNLTEDLAKSYGFGSTEGVLVNEVAADSPADKAGIKVEDIVTKINGRTISNENSLRNAIAALAPGKTVPIEVFRAGKTETLQVTIAKRDDSVANANADEAVWPADKGGLGVKVVPVTDEIRTQLRDRRLTSGVVISEVEPGSLAAQNGFTPGVAILGINSAGIDSLDSFRQAIANADFKRGVRLVVRANGNVSRLFIRAN
jgi:serine protease Do